MKHPAELQRVLLTFFSSSCTPACFTTNSITLTEPPCVRMSSATYEGPANVLTRTEKQHPDGTHRWRIYSISTIVTLPWLVRGICKRIRHLSVSLHRDFGPNCSHTDTSYPTSLWKDSRRLQCKNKLLKPPSTSDSLPQWLGPMRTRHLLLHTF